MRLEVAKRIVSCISQLDSSHINFIWHGGEPLLAGIPFYEMVYNLQRNYLKGKELSNSFQTNGTLIDEKWALFAKKCRFTFGISLDGPRNIHNLNRVFPNGGGTFDRVMEGVQILRKKKINPGIISVVTKSSVGRASDIFGFFTENNLYKINFSPCAEKKEGDLCTFSLTPEEWSQFMIEIFDEWIERDDPAIKVQLLESLFQGLIGGKPTLCSCTKDCSSYIAVNANGDLYLCGRFLGVDEFKIGNIMQHDLIDILCSEKYTFLNTKSSEIKKECCECQWESICNGGCTYYRYVNGSIDSLYYFCSSMKKLLSHMKEEIDQLEAFD